MFVLHKQRNSKKYKYMIFVLSVISLSVIFAKTNIKNCTRYLGNKTSILVGKHLLKTRIFVMKSIYVFNICNMHSI